MYKISRSDLRSHSRYLNSVHMEFLNEFNGFEHLSEFILKSSDNIKYMRVWIGLRDEVIDYSVYLLGESSMASFRSSAVASQIDGMFHDFITKGKPFAKLDNEKVYIDVVKIINRKRIGDVSEFVLPTGII